jgi:hypothetical protein
VKKTPKNVAHIVGTLERLRREKPEKTEFVAHIKEKRLLDSGVGLVMYWIDEKKNQRPPDGHWFIHLSSRFADQHCPRQRGGKTIAKLLVEFGILVPLSPPVLLTYVPFCFQILNLSFCQSLLCSHALQ